MITGVTNIKHSIRKKLELTLSEYVVLDYLQRCAEDNMPPDKDNCISLIGEPLDITMMIANKLKEKGFVAMINDIPVPTSKWTMMFGFRESDFRHFWQPVMIEDDEVRWRPGGSKENTRDKLKIALKECSIEQIIVQKIRYFVRQYTQNGLDFIMMAQRFVGRDKYFKSDYPITREIFPVFHQTVVRYEELWSDDMAIHLQDLYTDEEKEFLRGEQPEGPAPRNADFQEGNFFDD